MTARTCAHQRTGFTCACHPMASSTNAGNTWPPKAGRMPMPARCHLTHWTTPTHSRAIPSDLYMRCAVFILSCRTLHITVSRTRARVLEYLWMWLFCDLIVLVYVGQWLHATAGDRLSAKWRMSLGQPDSYGGGRESGGRSARRCGALRDPQTETVLWTDLA